MSHGMNCITENHACSTMLLQEGGGAKWSPQLLLEWAPWAQRCLVQAAQVLSAVPSDPSP